MTDRWRVPLSLRLASRLVPRDAREEVLGDLVELWEESIAARGPLGRTVWALRQPLAVLISRIQLNSRRAHNPVPPPLFDKNRATQKRGLGKRMIEMPRAIRIVTRSLVRAPTYSAAFVLTLGLGIGLNTAIFSIVTGVLLTSLPYADADRILYLRQPAVAAGVANASFSFREIADLRRDVRTIDRFVEYGDWTFTVAHNDPGSDPHRAIGGLVTSDYFQVLGLVPALGRTLTPSDDEPGAEPVALLTHHYWTDVFGADPNVLGRTVTLYAYSGPKRTRIVGVLPPGTHYTGSRRQDLFVNYAANSHYSDASMLDERAHRMTEVFARIAPGQTEVTAGAELRALHAAWTRQYRDAYPDRLGFTIASALWQDELTKDARKTFLILMGTVGLILLLACANIANLTLTNLVSRERELSVRAALGATRQRLRAQLFSEHLVLSLAGAALGLWLAVIGLDLLVQYAGRFTVRTGEIGINLPVLGFTTGVAVLVAFALAWGPSIPGLSGLGSASAAAGFGRGIAGVSRKQLQRVLVVSQLALSFMLLIAAGLMVRTLINLTRVDTGIDYENVVTMQTPNVTELSFAEDLILMDHILDEIREFPGVRVAAHAGHAPWDANTYLRSMTVRVLASDERSVNSPMAQRNQISPHYFQALGIPLRAGRAFTSMDDESSELVAIFNESMARHLFGGDDPIGQRIAVQDPRTGDWRDWRRVVGVTADTREYGLALSGAHTMYVPAAQWFAGGSVIVRTTGEMGPLVGRIREIVERQAPHRPLDNVSTLAALRADDIASERLNATLFAAFAGLALLIAAVGVLGVLSFAVSQRTREFGVRMALGAQRRQISTMVLREGIILAGIALAAGGVAAASLSSLLSGLLFEVEPTDPLTFLIVGAILAAIAIAASWLPARRATQADPLDALRAD